MDSHMLLDNAEFLNLTTAECKLVARAKQKNKIAMANSTMTLLFNRMMKIFNIVWT